MESLFLVFLILGFLHFSHGVGYGEDQKHLKLKNKFNLVPNGTLKTFKTNNGDIIDCVNVYKQPAFDHPLLKNHTIQWEPTVIPKELNKETSFVGERPTSFMWSNECPPASIPIRRPIRKKLQNNRLYQFAVVKMKRQPNDMFYGAMTHISVNNPSCQNGQSSGASIWIGSDLSDQKNFIKAGWMVYPEIYGDSISRFSLYWTGDGFHKTGCYDLQCPGFVQVNKNVIVRAPFSNISIHGRLAFENYYYIFQDVATKNWWLMFGTTRHNSYVGYWPKELFPRLGGGGTVLHFGGSVMTLKGQNFPSMGDGYFPDGLPADSNYFRLIHYVNKSNYLVPPHRSSAEFSIDNPQCYNLIYDEDGNDDFRHALYMGGPGGHVSNNVISKLIYYI